MQPVYGPSLPSPYQQFYDVATGMPTQPQIVDYDGANTELRHMTYAQGTSPRVGMSPPLPDDGGYGFTYNFSPYSSHSPHSPTAAAAYEPLLSHSMSSLSGAYPMEDSYARVPREDSFSAPPPLPTSDGCKCVYCVHHSKLDADHQRQKASSPPIPTSLKHPTPNVAPAVVPAQISNAVSTTAIATVASAAATIAEPSPARVDRQAPTASDDSVAGPRFADDNTPAAKARLRTVDPSTPHGSRRNAKKKAERTPHTPSRPTQAAIPPSPRTEPKRQSSRGSSHVVDLLGHHDRLIVAKSPIELCEGDYVIFEGDRGYDMGRVHATSAVSARPDVARPSLLPMVIRSATTDEIKEWTSALVDEAALTVPVCQEVVDRLGIKITITTASYQFDRQKLTFFYDSPQRVDFRRLLSPMFTKYRCRIWLERNE